MRRSLGVQGGDASALKVIMWSTLSCMRSAVCIMCLCKLAAESHSDDKGMNATFISVHLPPQKELSPGGADEISNLAGYRPFSLNLSLARLLLSIRQLIC